MPEVISLTSSLTNTTEYGYSTVLFGNVIDKLHKKYRFTNTGTTEESNLSSLEERGNQVNNFDTSFKKL